MKSCISNLHPFFFASSHLKTSKVIPTPHPDLSSLSPAETDAGNNARAAESIRWESVDLTAEGVDIEGLLRSCPAFDGTVPGINHMPGGERAGLARWEGFKKSGLSQYAARRNNPMLRFLVSIPAWKPRDHTKSCSCVAVLVAQLPPDRLPSVSCLLVCSISFPGYIC